MLVNILTAVGPRQMNNSKTGITLSGVHSRGSSRLTKPLTRTQYGSSLYIPSYKSVIDCRYA